ncbi:DUF1707 SHOCT-like domain-containing protein [Rhodococcus oxybenzonivorans]|nr:DUF1707 domain-containing protein [Rhodococcus oxybenzonivorans]
MTELFLRAADTDRNQIAITLEREVGTGRLTLDEYSDRITAAYRAHARGTGGFDERSAAIGSGTGPGSSRPQDIWADGHWPVRTAGRTVGHIRRFSDSCRNDGDDDTGHGVWMSVCAHWRVADGIDS